MSSEIHGEKRKALLDLFFHEQDQELMASLRKEMESQEIKAQLAAVSGIRDEAALDILVEQGIEPGTVAALTLAPLVLVAWCDGDLHEKERDAILAGAAAHGVGKNDPAHQLLESWLKKSPNEELFTLWEGYVTALAEAMPDESRRVLRDQVMGWARDVAEAAGGILGLGSKTSGAEQKTLDRLRTAFGE